MICSYLSHPITFVNFCHILLNKFPLSAQLLYLLILIVLFIFDTNKNFCDEVQEKILEYDPTSESRV